MIRRVLGLLAATWCLPVFAGPNPIQAPEAWLDDALKASGYTTTFRAEVTFPTLPEVPLQVEKERCYALVVIAVDASNFPEMGVARWGSERGNAKQGEVYDGNYKTRLYDLGCTLKIRALKLALSASKWPAGKGVVKLYSQTISKAEYEAGLGQVSDDQKYFKKLEVENERMAKIDAQRRANMTCQGCVDAYAQCVRGASGTPELQSCGGSFDSCVDNSDVIRKKASCRVAKH